MDPTPSATKTGQVFDWAVLRRLLGYVRPGEWRRCYRVLLDLNYVR